VNLTLAIGSLPERFAAGGNISALFGNTSGTQWVWAKFADFFFFNFLFFQSARHRFAKIRTLFFCAAFATRQMLQTEFADLDLIFSQLFGAVSGGVYVRQGSENSSDRMSDGNPYLIYESLST
jgi:hypothetical protein